MGYIDQSISRTILHEHRVGRVLFACLLALGQNKFYLVAQFRISTHIVLN